MKIYLVFLIQQNCHLLFKKISRKTAEFEEGTKLQPLRWKRRLICHIISFLNLTHLLCPDEIYVSFSFIPEWLIKLKEYFAYPSSSHIFYSSLLKREDEIYSDKLFYIIELFKGTNNVTLSDSTPSIYSMSDLQRYPSNPCLS